MQTGPIYKQLVGAGEVSDDQKPLMESVPLGTAATKWAKATEEKNAVNFLCSS